MLCSLQHLEEPGTHCFKKNLPTEISGYSYKGLNKLIPILHACMYIYVVSIIAMHMHMHSKSYMYSYIHTYQTYLIHMHTYLIITLCVWITLVDDFSRLATPSQYIDMGM